MGPDVFHADDSPAPPDSSSHPRDASAGCVVAIAAAILLPLFLYVGSFVFLILDAFLDWGFVSPFDERTREALEFVYAPLVWLVNLIL